MHQMSISLKYARLVLDAVSIELGPFAQLTWNRSELSKLSPELPTPDTNDVAVLEQTPGCQIDFASATSNL